VNIKIRAFAVTDTAPVIALWERCGLVRSWDDAANDTARKMRIQPELGNA